MVPVPAPETRRGSADWRRPHRKGSPSCAAPASPQRRPHRGGLLCTKTLCKSKEDGFVLRTPFHLGGWGGVGGRVFTGKASATGRSGRSWGSASTRHQKTLRGECPGLRGSAEPTRPAQRTRPAGSCAQRLVNKPGASGTRREALSLVPLQNCRPPPRTPLILSDGNSVFRCGASS